MSTEKYPCANCEATIDVGPNPWDVVGDTFTCPSCEAKNYFYPDEDEDCGYWFAFELEES